MSDPIVPLNPNLLKAPELETGAGGSSLNGGLPLSRRRLTIYYQDGSTVPVTPKIDQGIDIAGVIQNQLASYLGDRTSTNNIPINALPVELVGYDNTQNPGQTEYIDSNPEARDQLNDKPTMFEQQMASPDQLGIHQTKNNGRIFQIKKYIQEDINPPGSAGHGKLIDEKLLSSRGHNVDNPFVSVPAGSVDISKRDNALTLGSYFYQSLKGYVSGSDVKAAGGTTTLPPMTIEQMKNVGLNIMFEAAEGQAGMPGAQAGWIALVCAAVLG